MMRHLYELLEEHRERLLVAWAGFMAGDAGTASVPNAQARADASMFLSELTAALRLISTGEVPASAPLSEPRSEEETTATPDALTATRALGSLHGLILEIAADRGIRPTLAEQLTLASHMNIAVGRAAGLETRRHKRELRHLAHQLRNPLGSALMALALLRSRIDLGENTRLAELTERNLKRMQGLIDEVAGDQAV
jgi:signal transduction histidine kinase